MNDTILVPLDGSALAETSIPHAVALARMMSSTITLLRSVPPAYVSVPLGAGFPATSEIWEAAAEEPAHAKQYLADLATRLRSQEDGLVVETEIPNGDPASAIVHYAEQHPRVSLIAMATHGRSGLNRLVFGSVAEKVLQGSPVPLLVVRPASGVAPATPNTLFSGPKYDKILVPLDGSEFAELALDRACVIASNSGAILLLLTVEPYPREGIMDETLRGQDVATLPHEQEETKEYLYEVARRSLSVHHGPAPVHHNTKTDQAHLKVQTQISYGNPADEILKVCAHSGVDMIVMSTHGRNGLKRLWLGSVAIEVVRDTAVPILLVRGKERVNVYETQHVTTTPARLIHQTTG